MIVRHVSDGDGAGDAEYAVRRLVRGMCSSREAARQGFASCLAQALTVLPKDKVGALHTALALRRRYVPCTVYRPARAAEIRAGVVFFDCRFFLREVWTDPHGAVGLQ